MRLFIFLFLLASSSCNQPQKNMQGFPSDELKDYIQDTLFLEKDSSTKYLGGDMVYLEKEGTRYLYTFQNYRLLRYAYPSGKLLSAQEYEEEGPDGIGAWVSGHLINREEIFFISNAKELVKANHQGKVLQRYPLPETPEKRMGANYNTMNNNNPMFYSTDRREIIIKDVPFVLKEPHLGYKDWILNLNLENGSYDYLSFEYPLIYSDFLDDPELGAYFHMWLEGQQKHLIGFAATDSILVIEGSERFWIAGKSSRTLKFLPGRTETEGEWTMFLPNNESSRYKWFLHDPCQKVILRGVVLSTEQDGEGNQDYYHKSFILFNEDLQRTGELFYTSKDFSNVGFATPNGFYLPLAQQKSDDETAYVRLNFQDKNIKSH